MKIEKTELKNGIKIVIAEISGIDIMSTNLTVGAGGRYETPKIFGISHFLEHMAFKGTKKYPSMRQLSEAIESVGGQQNAWTSDEYTTYWNKVLKENSFVAFDTLAEQVSSLLLPKKEIENERGVIIEEINRADDNPQSLIWHRLNEVLWPGQNAASDVLGPKRNIKRIARKDFLGYMKKHYTAKNMTLCVAGGVKMKEILPVLNKTIGVIPRGKKNPPVEIKVDQKRSRTKLFKKEVEQTQLVLAYKTFSNKDPRKYALNVLMTLLGGGMSSVLFREIREKRGLAYAIYSGTDLYSDAGIAFTYAGLNKAKTEEAIRVIKEELWKTKEGKFSERELKRAKEYSKGRFVLRLDGSERISSLYGIRELLDPDSPDPRDVPKIIEKITKKEIVSVANELFDETVENMVVVGPFKDEAKFAKILQQ